MIDTQELINVEEMFSRTIKFSDWLELQPVENFTLATHRDCKGRMCASGFFADFHGFNWSAYDDYSPTSRANGTREVGYFLRNKSRLAGWFPEREFDGIFATEGPQVAKEFAVNWYREKGV